MTEYAAAEIGLCAYLICKGHTISEVRRSLDNPRRFECVFSGEVKPDVLDYYQGATVVAKDFNRAAVEINAMIREARRND